MDLHSFAQNKVVKNAGWIIGLRIVRMVLSFFVSILVARYLQPSNYGLISYAAAYTTFFYSISTLGIPSVLVKELLDKPEQEGTTMGTSLLMRFLSSTLSVGIILAVSAVLDHDEPLTRMIVAICSISMIFQTFETYTYWFQAHLLSKYSSIAVLLGYIVGSLYKLVLLRQGKDVAWFAFATSVDYLVVAVFLSLAYKGQRGPKLGLSRSRGKEIFGVSHHFILTGMMVAIYGSVDRLMLKHMLDEAAVGYYSNATSICTFWTFVLAAIIDSMYPTIVEAHHADQEKFERRNRQMYAIVFYTSCLAAVVLMAFGEPVIGILYGDSYLPAAAPLRILVWMVPFSYLGVARDVWVVCESRQKYLKYIYMGSAVSNVLLNSLLIPHFGTAGAAAASLITQFSTILIFPCFVKELRPNVKLILQAICLKGVK